MTPNQAMRDGILAMLQSEDQIAPWGDVVAVWELDEASGAAYAVDAVAGLEAVVGDSGVTMGSTGKIGRAATMGSGTIGYATGFEDLDDDFTVMFWTFFAGGTPSATACFLSADVKIDFEDGEIRFKESNLTVASSATGATTGAWEHWAIRRTGAQIAIYKNAAALALNVDTASTEEVESTPLTITGSGVTIDQFAVFSVAKSGANIASIYNSGSGLAYESKILYAPAGPFLDIEMGPFTANEDPLTVLERMSAVGARFPGLFLSKFPIDVAAPSDEQRSSPGRQLGYDANWLLVAVFPTLRDTDAVGSREWEVFEWRSRVKLAMESKFIAGVPATPTGWEFRWARYASFSGVYLPEAYVETLPFVVRADGACRTDV